MANELRVRQNFLGGLIEDNPLLIGATTLTSAGLAAMVAIGSTQHLPITLDPDGLYGEPEIVYVTAHTASATTATILRGQEGTTARQHQQDVRWSHGLTVRDAAAGRYQESVGTGAGDQNTTSTTYVQMAGINAVSIPASAADVLQMTFSAVTYCATAGAGPDIAFGIAGTARTDKGVARQQAPGSNYVTTLTLSRTYLVVAADISSGAVAVAPFWKAPSTGTPVSVGNQAGGLVPTLFVANLGPQGG